VRADEKLTAFSNLKRRFGLQVTDQGNEAH
jgi:hypothetical protein